MKKKRACYFSSDAEYFTVHLSRTSARLILQILQLVVLAALLWFIFSFLWNLEYSDFNFIISSILYPFIVSSFSVLFLIFSRRYKLWWIAPVLLALGIGMQYYFEFSGEYGPFHLQFTNPSILESIPPPFMEHRNRAYSILAFRSGASLVLSLITSFVTAQLLSRRQKKKLLLQDMKNEYKEM